MSLASRPKGGFPPRGKARSAKADAFVMRKAVPASAPWDRDAAAQRLAAACQALGAGLPVERQAQLLDYLAQLQRWNRTYNLTALRDPDQMLVQHLFDRSIKGIHVAMKNRSVHVSHLLSVKLV